MKAHITQKLPSTQVKAVLRAILYSIFFHRTLETIEPETYELLDTHIAFIPNETIDKIIRNKVDEFGREVLERGLSKGEVS